MDDNITGMRKLAKSLSINGDVERYAIQRGLSPELLAHMIRAETVTIDDVIKAARIAETADTIAQMSTTTSGGMTRDKAIIDATATRQLTEEDFYQLRKKAIQSTTDDNVNALCNTAPERRHHNDLSSTLTLMFVNILNNNDHKQSSQEKFE